MDWKEFFSPDLKLFLVIISLITAYFNWRKAKEEANSFRQQLVSLLHHSEGINLSLKSIAWNATQNAYTSVKDVAAAINSAEQNAEALFFGLIEAKVGGIPLKNDLDSKYAEWADLELERKKIPLKNFIKENSKG